MGIFVDQQLSISILSYLWLVRCRYSCTIIYGYIGEPAEAGAGAAVVG